MATISLKDAGSYLGAHLPTEMREAAHRGLVSAANRGVQVVIAEIIPACVPQPVDRGVYRAGWKARSMPEGAVIENLEPHAALVEHGVRAAAVKVGRKLIAALAEWASRHGFQEPERAAWAVARKMQERGLWGERGLGVKAKLDARLRGGIVREEVEREVGRMRL